MNISLTSCGQTDVGLKRQKNEDSYLIDESLGLFVVADGMGGHKGGDMASSMAVAAMKEIMSIGLGKEAQNFSPREAMHAGYTRASQSIYQKSHVDSPELQGMGTTMVSALFYENRMYFGNVGDSRAYLIRDGKMWQLTEDHSLLNEHIRAGLIRDTDAEQFQAKNVITRSVGFEKEVICDVIEKIVQPGDRYMMCSDGLCGLVEPQELLNLCLMENIQESVTECIEDAKRNGGDDNITVVIVDFS